MDGYIFRYNVDGNSHQLTIQFVRKVIFPAKANCAKNEIVVYSEDHPPMKRVLEEAQEKFCPKPKNRTTLLVFLCSILACELGITLLMGIHGVYLPDFHKRDGGEFISHPFLGYIQNPKVKGINRLGLFNAEISPHKAPHVIRIAIIGDSIIRTPVGSSTIPLRVERLLQKNHPHQRFEVINAGVRAYSSLQMNRLLSSVLVPLELDAVVVVPGWNDIRLGMNPSWYPEMCLKEFANARNNKGGSGRFFFVTAISLATDVFRTPVMPESAAPPPPTHPPSGSKLQSKQKLHCLKPACHFFEENLENMARVSKENHIPMILSCIPTRLSLTEKTVPADFLPPFGSAPEDTVPFEEAIQRVCARTGTFYLHTNFPIWESKDVALFKDFCHPTSEGADQMAQHLVDALSQVLSLPKQAIP